VVIATLLQFWDTAVNAVEEDRLLHIRIEVDIIEREDFIVVGLSAAEMINRGQLLIMRRVRIGSGFGDKLLFLFHPSYHLILSPSPPFLLK